MIAIMSAFIVQETKEKWTKQYGLNYTLNNKPTINK